MSNYTFALRASRLSLIVASLFLLSACLTAPQVRQIVDESNQQTVALLTSGDGVSVATDGEDYAPGEWQGTAKRLQMVITRNQGNPTIADPLRLRLAYLLLTADKKSTAEEVRKTITGTAKFSERDKILYENWDFFKWWAEHGPEGSSWSQNDRDKQGQEYRAKLFALAGASQRDPEIKAWLNYTAARVGYRTALSQSKVSLTLAELSNTLPPYAANFGDPEKAIFESTIKGVKGELKEGFIFLPWALRAKFVYCDSFNVWSKSDGDVATFPAPDWVTGNLNFEADC